jgi:hypothetical protein
VKAASRGSELPRCLLRLPKVPSRSAPFLAQPLAVAIATLGLELTSQLALVGVAPGTARPSAYSQGPDNLAGKAGAVGDLLEATTSVMSAHGQNQPSRTCTGKEHAGPKASCPSSYSRFVGLVLRAKQGRQHTFFRNDLKPTDVKHEHDNP